MMPPSTTRFLHLRRSETGILEDLRQGGEHK
jgi:hypothetical protein